MLCPRATAGVTIVTATARALGAVVVLGVSSVTVTASGLGVSTKVVTTVGLGKLTPTIRGFSLALARWLSSDKHSPLSFFNPRSQCKDDLHLKHSRPTPL